MVRFDAVTVRSEGKPILNGVSFSIGEGEKVVFYGKSGAGKTTVLTTILGAHVPAQGKVYFADREVGPDNIVEVRRSVSYIGQEPVLGAENIRDAILLPYTFKANRRKPPPEEKILETLERLHLGRDILESEAAVVSGGEKQRIAIARELLQRKKLFLVDELTSALDMESKRAVLELFGNSDYTLVSVSHDPDWYRICSRFMKMEGGRIVHVSDHPEL